MRTNKIVFFLSLLLFLFPSFANMSAQGWLYVAEAPLHTTWRPNDVIETPQQDFLVSYWDYSRESTIIKLSRNGSLQSSVTIRALDTTVIISKLFHDEGFHYTAVGLCTPSSGSTPAIMTLKFDENLNILQRKVVSCTVLSRPLLNMTLLKHYQSFKIALTETDHTHHLAKFSLDGELQQWQTLEVDSLVNICNLFEIIDEDDHFGMFANTSNNSYAAMGTLVFDDSLNLIKRRYFPQWESLENDGCVSVNYLFDNFNSMIIANPSQTGYLVSARLRESLLSPSGQIIKPVEQSSIIALTDLDFAMREDYHVVEHFNDTVEMPAFYNSIDYYSSNASNTYHCSVLGTETNEGWPYIPSTVIVTKIADDFNVVWKKRLLSGKAYSPFAIRATSDGGCIVAGWVYDFNTENRFDLFALKINSGGTVGVDEIQEESMAFVYPNPARESITIGGVEARETLIYNALGQCVMRFNGNEVNVEKLLNGIYLMRIDGAEGKLHTLRLVVHR